MVYFKFMYADNQESVTFTVYVKFMYANDQEKWRVYSWLQIANPGFSGQSSHKNAQVCV